MLPQPTESFRDPVHGYIELYDWEKDIVNSQVFQRLRGIRQLGLTSYVYHGAEHSRFGHSLGVMHLAGRIVDNVLQNPDNRPLLSGLWGDGDFQDRCTRTILEARLAGLLHDIGHAPFSHTGEKRLFPSGKSHEQYSAEAICSPDLGIREVIDANPTLDSLGVTSERVASVVSETGLYEVGFVREVLSSVWDVDKMDYLLRDSHYCGVRYGLYDLGRIINTVRLYDEDPDGALRLGVDVGGIHAIEGFILARYFMFTQVYFHKVRRAYDLLLTDFMAGVLEEELGRPEYPKNLPEYFQWTDWRMLAALEKRKDKDYLARCLATRQHPKPVYESVAHADPVVVNRALKLQDKVREEFETKVWPDLASDHPERFRLGDAMPVKIGNKWQSLQNLSKALAGLEEIKIFRLYGDVRGDSMLEGRMVEFCQNVMGGSSGAGVGL